MKILVVTGQLGIGGAERELVTFLQGAADSDLEVVVACLSEGGEFRSDVEELSGSRVLSPGTPSRLGRFSWIRKTVGRLRPELVHSWNLYPLVYFSPAFLRRRIPTVGFLQNVPAQSSAEDFHPRLFRYLIESVDGLVSNSSAALEELGEMNITPRHAKVIHNGVESRFFSPEVLPEAQRIRDEGLVAVGVGRLIPRKRADWMIRAIAQLQQRQIKVDLWLVGDGPDRQQLELLAAQEGVAERVRFWGARGDVERILAGADIFVHAAVTEGLPNAVQEAMAVGLPIVAPVTSGIPEIVTNGCEGRLYDVDDFDELVEALVSVAADRSLRADLAKGAKTRADADFRADAMAEAMERFYREVHKKFGQGK